MHFRKGMLIQCLIFEQFEMQVLRDYAILIALQHACKSGVRIPQGQGFCSPMCPSTRPSIYDTHLNILIFHKIAGEL